MSAAGCGAVRSAAATGMHGLTSIAKPQNIVLERSLLVKADLAVISTLFEARLTQDLTPLTERSRRQQCFSSICGRENLRCAQSDTMAEQIISVIFILLKYLIALCFSWLIRASRPSTSAMLPRGHRRPTSCGSPARAGRSRATLSRQGRGRARPVRSALLRRLAPTRHSGDGRSRLSRQPAQGGSSGGDVTTDLTADLPPLTVPDIRHLLAAFVGLPPLENAGKVKYTTL